MNAQIIRMDGFSTYPVAAMARAAESDMNAKKRGVAHTFIGTICYGCRGSL